MVGLTFISVVLLILNLIFLKKNRTGSKRRINNINPNKEDVFQKNCIIFNLSTREIEVLRLILAGHTYRSAADILFISEKTVDAHLRNIYTKANVKNKVELVTTFYN